MTVIASDNFNRADNTSLGSNWTTLSSASAPRIASNAVEPLGTGFADSVSRWSADSFPNDQYSQVSITTLNTDTNKAGGPCARASSSALTHYVTFGRGPLGASATLALRKVIAGSSTQFSATTKTINSGAVLRLEVSGTNLTAYINSVSQATATDSAISSGSAGLYLFADTGVITDAVIDNWEGGDLGGQDTPELRGRPFGLLGQIQMHQLLAQ